MLQDDPGAKWLLKSADPSVRYFTLTDVLGRSRKSEEVASARRAIPSGPRMRALFSGQERDGGFGVEPYKKWSGVHWRILSAVELGVPGDDARAVRAARNLMLANYLRWRHSRVRGLYRAHASMLGNPLGVFTRLGLAEDPVAKSVAEKLQEWQWPDGGWNCDSRSSGHSSFYETLSALWGLNEYRLATGKAGGAVASASEFFLRHRLFRSCKGEAVVDAKWLKLHYPLYWHYDILQGLWVLQQAGRLRDPRSSEALDLIEEKRMKDGTWRVEGSFWRKGNGDGPSREVVDWGMKGPNEMITLNALRVLVASGRLS